MSTAAQDKILERIRKLMRLAQDDGASEGEVENALRMARDLMDKAGIAEDQVVLEDDAAETVEVIQQDARSAGVITPWQQNLAWVSCYICDVRFVIRTVPEWRDGRRKTRKSIVFIGLPRDVAIACELYEELLVTIRTMARWRYGNGFGTMHRSYAEGFVSALIDKARRMQDASKQQASQAGAIILAKDAIIERYMSENMHVRSTKSRRSTVDSRAYLRGSTDGQNVDIGTSNRLRRTNPGQSQQSLPG